MAEFKSRKRLKCFSIKNIFIWISFILTQFSITEGFNLEWRIPKQVTETGESASNFFGYEFAVKRPAGNNPSVSLLIGSPKGGQPTDNQILANDDFFRYTTPGKLSKCSFDFDSTTENCAKVTPPGFVKDDKKDLNYAESLGLTMAINPNESDDMMICSPLRMRNCSSDYFLYGSCRYSSSFGSEWSPDRLTIKQKCPVEHLDLMFVLDGSRSVNRLDKTNFDRVKSWVKNVTGKFDIKDFASVGVIQYSYFNPELDIYGQDYLTREVILGQYHSHETFNNAVDNITYHGYNTFTAAALNLATFELLNSTYFNDSSTEKVIVLLTDGRSEDPFNLDNSASRARSLGIKLIAVGVADYSEEELLSITDDQENIFGLTDFSQLDEIVDDLRRSISSALEGSSQSNSTNNLEQAEAGIQAHFSHVSIPVYLSIYNVLCQCHVPIS